MTTMEARLQNADGILFYTYCTMYIYYNVVYCLSIGAYISLSEFFIYIFLPQSMQT